MKRTLRIALLCVTGLACLAAPVAAAIELRAGPYRVAVTSDPPVIPTGRARLRLKVTDQAGKPVTGARISTLAQMPGMPMGEREEEATPEAGQPGAYVAPASFGMEGGYRITVKISAPQGSGSGSVDVRTGDNTAAAGGFSFAMLLYWLLGLCLLAAIALGIWRAWKNGWRPNLRALARPQVLLSLLLLGAMLGVSAYAVRNWRRKGAMTPIEAQAANMERMAAPVGQVAVTLAEVERGPVAAAVTYTGTAMGFNEQDIYPRAQGWITWMPLYAGDRVRRGQLLAKLDTSELNARVAQSEAARRMADHSALISQQGYRQSLAAASEARSEVNSRLGMLEDARQQRLRSQGMLKQAEHELKQSQNEVTEAQQQLAAAVAERSEAEADLAAARTMAADAQAQLEAAKADENYLGTELKRSQRLVQSGVIAAAEYQKDRAAAQNATAKVDQAEARIRQVQAQIRAAESKQTRAGAMQRAASARIDQMNSKVEASRARIEQANADIAGSAARIRQAEADVEAARQSVRAMQAAADASAHQVEHSQEGVAEARAAVSRERIVRGYTEIRSLVDGVITQRNISPGVLVGPGQSILKVAQIRPIRIQANVPEADLARIRKGDRVRVRSQQPGAPEALSTVSAIFPAVDPGARQGIVEALLPNTDGRFLPGQFVTMEIITEERPSALRVPSLSILWRTEPSQFGQTGKQQAYVWIAEAAQQQGSNVYTCPMHPEERSDKQGLCPKCKMDLVPQAAAGKWRARRADVTVGATDGRFTEITGGLREHDHVVTSGQQGLHDGDGLMATNEAQLTAGMGGGPATAGAQPGTAAPGGKGKYYCPMHPEVASDTPEATCSKCGGMKLQPRPGAGS